MSDRSSIASLLRVVCGLAAVSLATTLATAQDLTRRAAPQAGAIALVSGRVYPVSGPVIADGYVIFDNGLITDVGVMEAAGTLPKSVAATVRRIDVTGKHIYPGFIGSYTQMGLAEIASVRATRDFDETGGVTPEVVASVALNPDSNLLTVTRSNGVLLCGTFPTSGIVPGRASVIQLEGWTSEDLTIKRDAGLIVGWPFMRTIRATWMDKGDDEQQKDIRLNLERIRDIFRSASAYVRVKSVDEQKQPTDLRFEAMRPYVTGATPQGTVFIEASDYDQIMAAIAFAREFSLKIVIVGGRDAPMAAKLLKERQIPVIVGTTHGFPKRDDSPYNEAYTMPLKLHEAGVTFSIASGEETQHERNLPYVAAMAVSHGLPWDAGLRSITLSAAEILGVADKVGSLDKGKHATLIVTDGPAMEVTTNVTMAFIQGRQIDLRNKQSELADKYREKYKKEPAK